ncbi:ribokinase/xylose isomerase [Scenedesmus sp. NREL 46B-D3]|nr:ribokinase/xylose isomerase [Scenedesmus sp. NREL 46B-D3]
MCSAAAAKQVTGSSVARTTTSRDGNASSNSSSSSSAASILVVGSVNVDIIVQVHRLPGPGETTSAASPSAAVAVGGKGANQAVAAARLARASPGGPRARFVCKFGNDSYAAMLQQELSAAGVDVSGCGKVPGLPSGHGLVMLEPDGTASSVVLGGANTAWREGEPMSHLMGGVGVVLLQREIPEHVNMAVAAAAAAAGVPVIQDVGGEDRPIPAALLPLLSYLVPNEPELQRLTGMATATEQQVIAAASSLVKKGARNVLVTLAERGSLLVSSDGSVATQEALPVPGGVVVDATAAGDAFRAGFAVGLVEGLPLQACLQLAAAAGAVSVSRMGAVPSLPTRAEAEASIALAGSKQQQQQQQHPAESTQAVEYARFKDGQGSPDMTGAAEEQDRRTSEPRNSAVDGRCSVGSGSSSNGGGNSRPAVPATCPYKFASRLNSMQVRRDLAGPGHGSDDVLGWIERQGRVQGLSLVDLNYPQHQEGLTREQILQALSAARLQAGAVCMRFPAEFRLGAFTNPEPGLRQRAVELAVAGCAWAARLGAPELIVWSPYDGYDYNFQAQLAQGPRQLLWRCLPAVPTPPGMRVSLEFKPTDASSRFAIVPNTGAALLLAQQVDRPNFGLTLDVGHLLMAGENPAQSVAMVVAAGKLFGMQLNDAHVRLGAEDGLAFSAANPLAALELVRWMQRSNYSGHVYFDTFPLNENPVREAEYNVRRFKALWAKAGRLAAAGIDAFAATHDAMGVMEALEADVNSLSSRH